MTPCLIDTIIRKREARELSTDWRCVR
jgi:hypothetical protein